MTYRVKIVRMLDGKRSESWLLVPGDWRAEGGSRYDRSAAIGEAERLWTFERRHDTGLVAVELVEVSRDPRFE